MRTIIVCLSGIVLAIVGPIILGHIFLPDEVQWIVKAYTTPPESLQWEEISKQLHRAGLIQLYLVNPLGGVIVGAFIGILQKTRPVILSVLCILPDFLLSFFGEQNKLWATSSSGIMHYGISRSLPFLTAIIAAAVCHLLMSRRVHHFSE